MIQPKKITIIGCGPGETDLMTLKGQMALNKADIVAGSKRLINDFIKNPSTKTLVVENNYQKVLDQVSQFLKENKKVVFLVSGDPLFYSYGETILKRFGRDNCEIIPGISSVQHAFSRLKESWKEYNIFSLHGFQDIDIQKIFKENNKFVLLLDPKNNLKFIKKNIKPIHGSKYQFYILSNLSLPNEKVEKISIQDFDKVEEESLSILVAKRLPD